MLILYALLLSLVFIIKQSNTQLFQITSLNSALSNLYTLVPNVAYDLNFSMPSSLLGPSHTVGLAFSARYSITLATLSNCKASTSSSVVPSTVSCGVTYFSGSQIYQINITGAFSTSTSYTFLRVGFTINNPYGSGQEPINVSIADGTGTMVGYGTIYTPKYEASIMTNCSVVSSSQLTSANATHTYSFNPAQMLIAQSYLLISMPPWSGSYGNDATSPITCTGIQGTDSSLLSCNAQTPIVTQTINVTDGLVSSNRTTSSISFSITQMRNPWSTKPFGPISVQLMYGNYLTQVCPNIYLTVTTPSSLATAMIINLTNLAISTTNSQVRLSFSLTNSIVFNTSMANRLQIQYPSSVTVSYAGTFSKYSQNSTQITLENIGNYLLSNFSVVTPPSTRPFNFIVTLFIVDSGVGYAIQTKNTSTFQCTAGTLTSVSTIPNVTDVNTITSYNIVFTIPHKLISGSFINVIFPNELNIQTASASCTISGHTCSIISARNITISISSTINAATSLSITIQSVLNALQAATTSSFAIYTYYDSGYDSLVDRITSGATVTMTPKPISTGSVTPSLLTTNAVASYQFSLTLNNPVSAGGFITITFPSSVTILNTTSLASASFGIGTCITTLSSSKINITNCFSTAMSNLPLTITLSNILNPPSFAPSNSFQFHTYGPTGGVIDYKQSDLTVTMNMAATTVSFSITPTTLVVGESTTYAFQIKHAITNHAINDSAVITIPSLMSVPATPNCTPTSGITTVACSQLTSTSLQVKYTSAPSQTISLTLANMQNYLIGDQAITFSLSIYDSNNYLMQTYNSFSLTYTEGSLKTVTLNNDNNIAVNELSNITLTITTPFSLYPSLNSSLTQLLITIPTGFTIGLSCSATAGICTASNTTTYEVARPGLTINNFTVILSNVLLNSFSSSSTSFSIVYSYNGFRVSTKSTGIVVNVYCTPPCQRCSTSQSTCLSCLPSPNTLIYYESSNFTCGASCISGKYPDTNKICQPCVSPCATCINETACLSCVANKWLHINSCLSICPSTYFNHSNGKCEPCQTPCKDCVNLTYCTSCAVGFFYNNWCVNASACPSGTFANQTALICENCTSPCATCSLAGTNCTSCINTYFYYSNICVDKCPTGMYESNKSCLSCVAPCATCLNATYCTTCATNYFFNGSCITANSCPGGTYANSTLMACDSCLSPCANCALQATNCTSCVATYLYYSNICTKNCPNGMYTSAPNCIACIAPCATCTSASFCLTCSINFYFNGTCVVASNCPSSTFANTSSMVCQNCTSPCKTCSLASTNCTTCITGYLYYSNICTQTCPSGMYTSTPNCLDCVAPCATCLNATYCQTCATNYLYNGTCVAASSCPAGTYSNSGNMTCTLCTSPCSTCSVTDTNCTACVATYLYYSNICTKTCPNQMYPSTPFCLNCVSPCVNCLNGSYCLSCITGLFMTKGSCVIASNCPGDTYANITTNVCQTCPTGCSACSNSATCSACTAPYFMYNFFCYSSCPSGTYLNSNTCFPCTSPCSNCTGTATNCTSCIASKVYHLNQCYDTCPSGTFNKTGTCTNCMTSCSTCTTATTCDSCSGTKYYYNSQCVTQCIAGFYGNSGSNTCQPCIPPCANCVTSSSNCTSCISTFYFYQGSCVNPCPSNYFPVSGVCLTCSNCISCLDATTCSQCKPNYYMHKGVCYATCPSNAPIPNETSYTCIDCDSSCLTCSGTIKNCTSCPGNTYLYKSVCVSDCPSGLLQDTASGTCKQALNNSTVYFPFSFCFLFCVLVCVASKCLFPQTESITTLSATISLCQFGSWCLLAYVISVNNYMQNTFVNVAMYISITIILLSIGVGISYEIVIWKQYECDKGIYAWKQYDITCVYAYRAVTVLSCISFRFFRFIYSKLFNRPIFSMYVADGARLLSTTSRLTFISIVVNTLPMIAISAIVLYKVKQYDQTFYCAIDTLLLGFVAAVMLTIDSSKNNDEFFDAIKNSSPFLKYRNMKNQDSLASLAGEGLMSFTQHKNQAAKSQVDDKEKDKIFRKITWLPNLNKYGHLNVIEEEVQKNQIMSLPEFNKLHSYSTYEFDDLFDAKYEKDPVEIHKTDGSRVIDEEFFFIQEEQQRKILEQREKEEEQKRFEEEEERKKEEQIRKQQLLAKRKKGLLEQQEGQRVDLQFTDLTAIDKVQNKEIRNKKSPLELLSNCKKADDKPVDQKSMKKLQDIAKKNGIDPTLMKQAFGVEKNYNPQLLNQVIDKHNHVKRQSIKQLFNDQNNPQILQELFSKNSKMDPKKLRQILNDPNAAALIAKMADKQKGILSPQMCRQLFDENSKYSKQFTKNLLSDDSGIDQEKLKQLLKENNAKGNNSPLKTLKKIGGQNLQNTEKLKNILGSDATLNPQNFTRVVNQLPAKALQNIFANKSKNANIISSKILNNKKINLKNLAPILQDEELVYQLAQALAENDPNIEQNLINLFKNADNIDPVKLKQMITDPIIRNKLLTKQVDPQFLQAILDKNSKSDLNILKQTLKQMPDQLIKQTFKFDIEKNTDFKNLAELFDANVKTDPVLVTKMLEPDLIKKIYVKGNDTKMVKKLVEKGNDFDPEVIKNVYGDHRNTNIFDNKPYNISEKANNIATLDNKFDDKQDEYLSHKEYSVGHKKNHKSQANMSRTAGGIANFSNSIVPISNQAKFNSKNNFNDISHDEWSLHEDGDIDEEQLPEENISERDESQQVTDQVTRKRKVRRPVKRVKPKLVDVRHPAQQIYLQRIEAPHEYAQRKASIRKKKKKQLTPLVMDEDNDIFDMDF